MSRPRLLLPLLALLVLAPRAALAADLDLDEARDYSSPQRFLFELKLGPFMPEVDSEFSSGTHPFQDIYGDSTGIMVRGEFDVELWRKFGTIAVGGTLGYFSKSAQALRDNGTSGAPSTSTERSGSTTAISLVPLSLLAIYRFDWPADHWRVPLVPYVKLGLNYTFWWIDNGDGTASVSGQDARGGTFGWEFHVGGAFRLDILEPSAARTLDVELGINHTYLFFEFSLIRADGFGAEKSLRVGDTTWAAGIAFEF
jgi:hypothetical protein